MDWSSLLPIGRTGYATMEDLLAARLQMAFSLGFHIIFACIGMTMPFLMAWAEWRWLRTADLVYKDLARAWARGVAIFFAVGAVSGTLLSFELGMLWPTFMEHAGPIIGMPFSWEGTAFFIEAIALGLFIYGWDRLNRWAHWVTGLVVGASGVASAIFVIAVNSWMNSPTGFDWVDGRAVNIDPVAAMFNRAWFHQSLHMVIAAFAATGFAVAGTHALLLLRDRNRRFHQEAMKLALMFGGIAALIQPLSGDRLAKQVAELQPAKLAAMEAHFVTEKRAAFIIGGLPNEKEERVDAAIRVPGLLSFLAHGDFTAEVIGLDAFAPEDRPPVLITHLAFQTMIGCGVLMMTLAVVFLAIRWRKPQLTFRTWLLWLIIACGPLGFIAVEAGWTATEVGRQPWVIYEVMRTADAVTPMPGVQYSLLVITVTYLWLCVILLWLMRRQIRALPRDFPSFAEESPPYSTSKDRSDSRRDEQ